MPFQKMVRQKWNVIPALSQRRQFDIDYIEPVKQIFTKLAILDSPQKLPVGCGDETGLNLLVGIAAQTLVLPFLQHAQKFLLQVEVHIANFIQKNSAGLSKLQFTDAPLYRPGKSTLFVPEQFAGQQVFGQDRTINGHKRFFGIGTMIMNRFRNQLLTGSACPFDEHRR